MIHVAWWEGRKIKTGGRRIRNAYNKYCCDRVKILTLMVVLEHTCIQNNMY